MRLVSSGRQDGGSNSPPTTLHSLPPSLPSSLLVHAIGSHRCGSFHPDYLNSGNRWQGKHVVFLRLRGKLRKHMDASDARAHAKTKKQKTQRPKKQMGLFLTDSLLVK